MKQVSARCSQNIPILRESNLPDLSSIHQSNARLQELNNSATQSCPQNLDTSHKAVISEAVHDSPLKKVKKEKSKGR